MRRSQQSRDGDRILLKFEEGGGCFSKEGWARGAEAAGHD